MTEVSQAAGCGAASQIDIETLTANILRFAVIFTLRIKHSREKLPFLFLLK
jgi:hypothetical protein